MTSKLNICAARRPGMTHAQYSRYVRDKHARLVLPLFTPELIAACAYSTRSIGQFSY